jgi:hypothetical protein
MDPHWVWPTGSGSGTRRRKMTPKNRIEKVKKFQFLDASVGCSLLRAEGFSWSLFVCRGSIGINKLQFYM